MFVRYFSSRLWNLSTLGSSERSLPFGLLVIAGAFLIPIVIFNVVGAIPIVYLEMIMGQYSQSGAVSVWRVCPLLKGTLDHSVAFDRYLLLSIAVHFDQIKHL